VTADAEETTQATATVATVETVETVDKAVTPWAWSAGTPASLAPEAMEVMVGAEAMAETPQEMAAPAVMVDVGVQPRRLSELTPPQRQMEGREGPVA